MKTSKNIIKNPHYFYLKDHPEFAYRLTTVLANGGFTDRDDLNVSTSNDNNNLEIDLDLITITTKFATKLLNQQIYPNLKFINSITYLQLSYDLDLNTLVFESNFYKNLQLVINLKQPIWMWNHYQLWQIINFITNFNLIINQDQNYDQKQSVIKITIDKINDKHQINSSKQPPSKIVALIDQLILNNQPSSSDLDQVKPLVVPKLLNLINNNDPNTAKHLKSKTVTNFISLLKDEDRLEPGYFEKTNTFNKYQFQNNQITISSVDPNLVLKVHHYQLAIAFLEQEAIKSINYDLDCGLFKCTFKDYRCHLSFWLNPSKQLNEAQIANLVALLTNTINNLFTIDQSDRSQIFNLKCSQFQSQFQNNLNENNYRIIINYQIDDWGHISAHTIQVGYDFNNTFNLLDHLKPKANLTKYLKKWNWDLNLKAD